MKPPRKKNVKLPLLLTYMVSIDNQLLKHISGLLRQIKELREENEKLSREIMLLKESPHMGKPILPEKKFKNHQFSGNLKSQTSRFNMATLMYANIHGFEKLNGSKESSKVLDAIDSTRFHFDGLLKKYNINKIKTIGDSFMAAGGIPVKNSTNPIQVVMSALQIHTYAKKRQFQAHGRNNFLRLGFGIHTGSVTAEIIGRRKISYDIKGDTVNIVSRMESMAEGNILVSAMTYELIKEFFECEYFGKMPVKYQGDLEIFQVKGLKPEFRLNEMSDQPNEEFNIKLKLIQLNDLEEVILDRMEKELPKKLYYHNVKHTVDVVTGVELIGWAEGLGNREILLLKTAALFHDFGHVLSYTEHEYQSTVLARQMLPGYSYSDHEIESICAIIMATKLPPQPKNLLEKIICDADLDYLGRSDMIPVSNTLYNELCEQNEIGSLNEWNKLQLKFISGHQYFTKTARRLREVNKQLQIERIKSVVS